MINHYIQSTIKQFQYYKSLGEKTFDQLEDEELFWQHNEQSNSIAIIVNHLVGNMLSRWTDFFTSDGEKSWRNRDLEFEPVINTRKELLDQWEKGWNCLFQALGNVNEKNFQQEVLIRNQKHSVVEAVNRQMMHYAYHIGQIVYVGRMIKGANWQSLSIPKGDSNEFNAEKFAKGKH